jgi:hypothetical protein
MKLPAVVEKLDDVPEAARALYRADGDRFVIDADLTEHPAVSGLANAYVRVREEGAQLAAEHDAVKAKTPPHGFSAEEWYRLKALDADLDAEGAAALETVRTEHAEAMAQRERRLAALTRFLHRTLVDAELREALTEFRVKPQFVPAVMAMLRQQIMEKIVVVERGGELQAIYKNGHGEFRVRRRVLRWAQSQEAQEFLDKPEMRPTADSFTAMIRG